MPIEWTSALESGVREIDDQHKQLFLCMNSFFDAWVGKKSAAEIKRHFQFLERYVDTHFSWEEKYMLRFKYPSYAEHKARHDELTRSFMKLENEFNEFGPTEDLLDSMSRFLIDWLLSHIHGFDIALGAFLKKKTADAPISSND
jgi:hemerythrin